MRYTSVQQVHHVFHPQRVPKWRQSDISSSGDDAITIIVHCACTLVRLKGSITMTTPFLMSPCDLLFMSSVRKGGRGDRGLGCYQPESLWSVWPTDLCGDYLAISAKSFASRKVRRILNFLNKLIDAHLS
jgi:hypothetical protein